MYDIGKEQIITDKVSIPSNIIGVYFLIKDNEIIYVGQSEDIMSRISQHNKDISKNFDSFSIIECSVEQLSDIESHYIYKFRPKFNSSLPTNDNYKSLQQIKHIHNISSRVIRLWMSYRNIKEDEDNIYRLSDLDEINEFKDWMNNKHSDINLKQCPVRFIQKFIQETNTS